MNYILQQLQKLPAERGLQVNPDQTRARIRCFWHKGKNGGIESTASLFVNLTKNGPFKAGSAICFGCSKFVPDIIQAIFNPNGSKTVTDDSDSYVERLHDTKTKQILYDDDNPFDLSNAMPWNEDENWRTVNGKLLKLVGARLIFEEKFENLMLYLPCMVNGEHVGGIRANLEKRGKRNYFNTDGVWVKETGLYPYDFTKKLIKKRGLKTVVLEEGPRDSLKTLQHGIPALGVLGQHNWSETKADLILNLGVKKVITATDPDAPGDDLTSKIFNSLKSEIDVCRFNFRKYMQDKSIWADPSKKMDPGNAPLEVMKRLKAHIE